jgi:3-oxoacyl-[acyl-carrier protein] reductase
MAIDCYPAEGLVTLQKPVQGPELVHNMTVEHATASFPREAGIARYGEPEEIAELMAFLVSPGARWMTGSTLRMDGGEVKSI